MPRAKADRVVIHRIELGGLERQFVEGALSAYQFNQVSTPVVAGMSDISFMITLGSLLTLWFPDIILPSAEDGMDEVTKAIKSGIESGVERAREERAATGEATLDESTGGRDFLGRLYYNIMNPNWAPPGSAATGEAPGVLDALREILGSRT